MVCYDLQAKRCSTCFWHTYILILEKKPLRYHWVQRIKSTSIFKQKKVFTMRRQPICLYLLYTALVVWCHIRSSASSKIMLLPLTTWKKWGKIKIIQNSLRVHGNIFATWHTLCSLQGSMIAKKPFATFSVNVYYSNRWENSIYFLFVKTDCTIMPETWKFQSTPLLQ